MLISYFLTAALLLLVYSLIIPVCHFIHYSDFQIYTLLLLGLFLRLYSLSIVIIVMLIKQVYPLEWVGILIKIVKREGC